MEGTFLQTQRQQEVLVLFTFIWKFCLTVRKLWLRGIGVSSFLFCFQDFQQFLHKFCLQQEVALSFPLAGGGDGSRGEVTIKSCNIPLDYYKTLTMNFEVRYLFVQVKISGFMD